MRPAPAGRLDHHHVGARLFGELDDRAPCVSCPDRTPVDPDAEVISDRLGSKQRPPPQGLVLFHTGIEGKERRNLDHEDGGERGATLGRE